MRQSTTTLAVAAIGLLVAACGSNNSNGPASSTAPTTTPSTRPPVAQAALTSLLLTPAEVDGVMGTTGIATKAKADKLPDDSNKAWPQGWKWPSECLFVYDAGEVPVYAGSGYTASYSEDDTVSSPAGSNEIDPDVTQVVVLLPSANDANAFFTTSSQRWPACANRQFTAPGDADNPEAAVKVGGVSNANNTLSATMNVTFTKGTTTVLGVCQRALTVRNNVVIDVNACRGTDPGDAGVKIAGQIAGKVDKQ